MSTHPLAFELAHAAALARDGRLADAETVYRGILARKPDSIDVRMRLVQVLRRQGKGEAALGELHRAPQRPAPPELRELLASILAELGRTAEAEAAYRELVTTSPQRIQNWIALAGLLRRRGEAAAALEVYRAAAEAHPKVFAIAYNRGNALREAGRLDEARVAYEQAIALDPRSIDAQFNLGITLRRLGRVSEAAEVNRRIVAIDPAQARAWNNLGICLRALERLDEAEAAYREAVRIQPDYADAYYNLGNVLADTERLREAGVAYRSCLQHNPKHHLACFEAGNLLLKLSKVPEAEQAYRRAVAIAPGNLRYRERLAMALKAGDKLDEAVAEANRILEVDPENAEALALVCDVKELHCDWRGLDRLIERSNAATRRQLAAGERTALTSFRALARPMSEAEQLAVARSWADETERRMAKLRARLGFTFEPGPRERLRIGYVSQDFRNQAMGHLTRSMYALHDRSRFEIFGYSVRADDNSRYRRDIAAGCDHFLDVSDWPVSETARRIHADRIDILVDLMGYTEGNRMAIMALRPAPIQVGYLRFPGSSGASFIDYMLTDPVVTPPSSQPHYTEQLVRLPHCYQVNDHEQTVPDVAVSREAEGLPADGYVYCCFNNSYKIEPTMFDVWMRILKAVPDSVLWLLRIHEPMEANLRHEAAARGIDPERLIFTKKAPKLQHLARHVLADLFLDTRYYTAHTTASDALVAGVPIITTPGETFASRVTASMLKAIGLDEFVLPTLEAYERRAIELGRDRRATAELRERIHANRPRQPLFDTRRWVRNAERAYSLIWENYLAGRPPRPFDVVEE